MAKSISSVHNLLIKELAKLGKKNERYKQKRFIAEGFRTCKTLIEAGHIPEFCFATRPLLAEAQELFNTQELIVMSEPVMQRLSQSSTPSGIIAIFPIPSTPIPILLQPGLVLVELNDPGNVGTLLRMCAAMNKKMVILIGGADPYHPKVIQASAGTIGLLTMVTMDWNSLVDQAQQQQISLCALVPKGGSFYSELNLNKSLLVVGNEAHGLSESQINDCSQRLTLTMPGKTESLNAAIAGSIALYLAWGLTSTLN